MIKHYIYVVEDDMIFIVSLCVHTHKHKHTNTHTHTWRRCMKDDKNGLKSIYKEIASDNQ